MYLRTRELAQKRSELLAHIAWQRVQMGHIAESAAAPLRNIDRSLLKAQRFLSQPIVLLGAAAVAAVIGPRRIIRTLARTWLASTATQRLLQLLSLRG